MNPRPPRTRQRSHRTNQWRNRAKTGWPVAVAQAGPVERASALDLMQLATDDGAVPNQVGAVLVLEAGDGFDAGAARRALAERITRIPRLRQRLVRTPVGCGRPVWVDDPRFDPSRHLAVVSSPRPGEDALHEIAVARITTPLDRSQPLWSATLVTDVGLGQAALVVVFHHVLADGIGGLQALAGLLDGAVAAPAASFPRPPPGRRALAVDAVRDRLAALRRLPRLPSRVRDAVRELGPRNLNPVPASSLNRPTGTGRRLALVRADLSACKGAAGAGGATVNDVVLTAVAGALHHWLLHRGERLDELVVSLPVATAPAADGREPGNHVGVMPVRLPTGGSADQRLRDVAAITTARKRENRAASAALVASTFRLLAALGLLRWVIDHQRLVHTFVTNLAGPPVPVTFVGLRVTDLRVVSLATGNATVSFAVVSYAGTVIVTIVADATHVPDLDGLVDALQHEFDEVVGRAPSPDMAR